MDIENQYVESVSPPIRSSPAKPFGDHDLNRFLSPLNKHQKQQQQQYGFVKMSPAARVALETPLPASPMTPQQHQASPSISVASLLSPGTHSPQSLLSPTRTRVFASPLKFRNTPPPPPPLNQENMAAAVVEAIQPNLQITLNEAAEEIASDEMVQQSFALCAEAQQLLASSSIKPADEPIEPPTLEQVVEDLSAPIEEVNNEPQFEALPEAFPSSDECNEVLEEEEAAIAAEAACDPEPDESPVSIDDVVSSIETSNFMNTTAPAADEVDTCTNVNCLALLDLSENLSLEVSELNTRYNNLQEEGARLYKQYEIKCAMLKATKAHNQSQQEYITNITREHEDLRNEYQELYHAYQELENLYNTNIATAVPSTAGPSQRDFDLLEENIQLKAQMAKVQEELEVTQQQAEESNELMEEKLAETSLNLRAREATIQQLQEDLVQSQQELDAKTQQLAQQSAKLQQFESEHKQALEGLNQKLSSTNSQLSETMTERDTLQRKYNVSVAEHDLIQHQCTQLKSELKDLKLQFQSVQQLTNNKSEEIQDAEREIQELTKNLNEKSAVLQRTEEELVNAQQENDSIKSQLSQATQQFNSVQSELSNTQTDLTQLTIDKANLLSELAASTSMVELLRIETSEIPQLKDNIHKLELLVEESTNNLNSSIEKIASLEDQFQHQTDEFKQEQEQKQHEFELTVALITDQKTHVEEELKQVIEQSQTDMAAIKGELEAKQSELSSTQQHNLALKQQVDTIPALTASLQTVRRDLAAAQEKSQQQSNKIGSLELKIGSLEQQLKEQFENHAYDLKCSASVTKELEVELEKMKEECEAVVKKNKDQKKKIEDLRATILKLESNKDVTPPTPIVAPVSTISTKSLAQAAEIERLSHEMLLLRRENATLSGRLQATETTSAAELNTLKNRLKLITDELEMARKKLTQTTSQHTALNTKEIELQAAQLALQNTRTQLTTLSTELEQLRTDKEQLLQQVELLMESTAENDTSANGAAANATIATLTAQIATLQAHNADLKSYMTRYKATGDAKMSSLSSTHQKLITQISSLCQILVEQKLVKKDNPTLYQSVQQIATAIKQPTNTTTPLNLLSTKSLNHA